jgi:hypothetical protein
LERKRTAKPGRRPCFTFCVATRYQFPPDVSAPTHGRKGELTAIGPNFRCLTWLIFNRKKRF